MKNLGACLPWEKGWVVCVGEGGGGDLHRVDGRLSGLWRSCNLRANAGTEGNSPGCNTALPWHATCGGCRIIGTTSVNSWMKHLRMVHWGMRDYKNAGWDTRRQGSNSK